MPVKAVLIIRGLSAGNKLAEAFDLYTSACDILQSDGLSDVRDTDSDVKAALAVIKSNLAAVCLSVQSYGDVVQASLLISPSTILLCVQDPDLQLLCMPITSIRASRPIGLLVCCSSQGRP